MNCAAIASAFISSAIVLRYILATTASPQGEFELNTRRFSSLLLLLFFACLGCEKTNYDDLIAAKKERDLAREAAANSAEKLVVPAEEMIEPVVEIAEPLSAEIRGALVKEIENAGGYAVLSKSDSTISEVDFADISNDNSLLAKLSDCTQLKRLSFNGSTLDAKAYEILSSFNTLERLDIPGATLDSEAIKCLGKLPKLKFLQMAASQFSS